MARGAVLEAPLADRVLDAVAKAPNGLTDFELAHYLGAYLSSINAARHSLVRRGLVKHSGAWRPSGRGGQATVWVIAE